MRTRENRELKNNLPGVLKDLLKDLVTAADLAGIQRIALVGGIVRDHIIALTQNKSIEKIHDVDLVVEGSAEILAKNIKSLLGDSRVDIIRLNPDFQTVELKIDDVSFDIARARIENYLILADNPEIEPSSIEKDLLRRDFTINSMAFDLRHNKLIDLFEGSDSILRGEIKFLHHKSVAEDPTRIIRAARYSARLNFDLSKESLHQITSTIKTWPWLSVLENSSKNTPPALAKRLEMELRLLLEKEENWEKGIELLQQWGALILLDENIQNDNQWKRRVHWAVRLGINPLTAFIAGAANPLHIATRLQIPECQKNFLLESSQITKHFHSLNMSNTIQKWGAARWCNEIESSNWKKESIGIAICLGIPVWKPLLRWWAKWSLVKAKTSAKDLLANGWPEGPLLGKELKRLRDIELEKY
ncbi:MULTISPECIES: CCA tRNA nucleotidyltransferase [unclassified Prochlorococcus]|uniref:CCA tRNA nucleotidyltransferase n=1 Tax=unclassified Prochlorococcus TaxID=2627481 RepID=UPI0005339E87|nr:MULTISPECIES: CCA tRNA nucleotidyltransferase [unclassified Prochlorococcus]KGG16625.1 tRNA nucleotidyltransferase [Prochlorococcus sp. MIT 0602]KGG18403.1 tRNA nucleotidyltransferase [Prochlorococcus sp. MIT 0603]